MPSKLKAHAPEETSPGKTKTLIYGPPGVGKTWFALSFPAPYFIDTEGGADLPHYQQRLKAAGGAYMGPKEGSLDFGTVLEQMQALATEKHPFKTLVIDSITKLFQLEVASAAERLGDKDAFGASKKPAIAWMRRLLNWSSRCDLNILFISHETGLWENDAKGNRVETGKTADIWEKLMYELHLGLHAQKRGNSRVAVVKKSRLQGFPEGQSIALDYSAFRDCYGKDFIESDVHPILLATSEQVAEIKRLSEVLKVSEDEMDKVLTKANAGSISELSHEHAAKTVDWLKKKVAA